MATHTLLDLPDFESAMQLHHAILESSMVPPHILEAEYLDRLATERTRETTEAVKRSRAASSKAQDLASRTAETIASAREAIARTHDAIGKRRG
jgi:hypothetical protein